MAKLCNIKSLTLVILIITLQLSPTESANTPATAQRENGDLEDNENNYQQATNNNQDDDVETHQDPRWGSRRQWR